MDANNPADIAKKRKMQMDLIIREGEYKKFEQKKKQLEFDNMTMKRKIDSLAMNIEANKKEMLRLEAEQVMMMAEIKKVKKEIFDM